MPCIVAGLLGLCVSLLQTPRDKRRLQNPFSYPSVPYSHTGVGTRQVHLEFPPGGSTAGAGGVSEEKTGRREARETEVAKAAVPAELAAVPACLVPDQQKPGEEVRGAALPVSQFITLTALPHPFPNLRSYGLQWCPGNRVFLFERLYLTVGVPPFSFQPSLKGMCPPCLCVCGGGDLQEARAGRVAHGLGLP